MLTIIILLVAFVGFTLLWSLLPLVSVWWWILYIVLGAVSTVLAFAIFILILLLIFKRTPYNGKYKHKIAWQIVQFIRIIMNIKLEVEGIENIPNSTFVVYGNHKSMLDVVIIYEVYHKIMSAVAKKNLVKVPVLNKLMEAFEVVPLDRENEREGVKALLHAISLVKGGYNMLIFPEGGIKSREVETMVGFKAGAFKLATKAQAIISPVSLIGSSKLSKNAPFHRTKVKVIIHKPITPAEYENENTFELGEKVREIIDNGVLNNKI